MAKTFSEYAVQCRSLDGQAVTEALLNGGDYPSFPKIPLGMQVRVSADNLWKMEDSTDAEKDMAFNAVSDIGYFSALAVDVRQNEDGSSSCLLLGSFRDSETSMDIPAGFWIDSECVEIVEGEQVDVRLSPAADDGADFECPKGTKLAVKASVSGEDCDGKPYSLNVSLEPAIAVEDIGKYCLASFSLGDCILHGFFHKSALARR